MQQSVCEAVGKNLEWWYMEEISESADKYHEPENHDDVAWDDVNNCKLDPARVREERKAGMDYFQKMQVYKKVQFRSAKM